MSLITTMLSSVGGGGGGTGSVSGVILSPVVAASTTAFTVTYANGSAGIGATLTNAGAQAAISMDGVSPTAGQRVLIKDQASTLQNGVYSVTTVGTGATNWVLTRTSDFDEPAEMGVGVVIEVSAGTVNDATLWEQSSVVTAVGTDAVTFTAMNTVGLTDSSAIVTNSAGKLIVATTTATEIGYVNGVTSAIQTQLDAKLDEGNLSVSGNTLSSTNAGGDVVLTPTTTGVVEIGANATHASTLRWKEDTDNGVNYITVSAPATLVADADYTLPSAVPTANGQVLTATTAGVFSFGNVTGTAAVQADQETGTSLVVPVVPGVQQFHPSTVKVWVEAQTDGGISVSYNVASLTDVGTGDVDVVIATDFSAAAYVVHGTALKDSTTSQYLWIKIDAAT